MTTEYYNGFVPVTITKNYYDYYYDYIQLPKIEANLISLANYTLDKKNVNVDKILDSLLNLQKTYKFIYIDSGGYQSKVGRIHKQNYKLHLETYYKILENIPNNMFLFSMDFPPCMKEKWHADAIDPETSSILTTESYTTIANQFNTKQVIIVTHFAETMVFEGWYALFDSLKEKLQKFEYFATGMLNRNYTNPKIISYYNAAKLFLRLHNIKPRRFHFLGTTNLSLIYPMYKDKDLISRSFDVTIKPFTGNLSLLRLRKDNKFEQFNVSFKNNSKHLINSYIDLFPDTIDKKLKEEINNALSYSAKFRLDKQTIHIAYILQLHANMIKAQLLEQGKLYISPADLGYNVSMEETMLKTVKTKNDYYKIIPYCVDLLK
mgnify:CR=1 FL=1